MEIYLRSITEDESQMDMLTAPNESEKTAAGNHFILIEFIMSPY